LQADKLEKTVLNHPELTSELKMTAERLSFSSKMGDIQKPRYNYDANNFIFSIKWGMVQVIFVTLPYPIPMEKAKKLEESINESFEKIIQT
jgi:hypothetical protein